MRNIVCGLVSILTSSSKLSRGVPVKGWRAVCKDNKIMILMLIAIMKTMDISST